MTHFSEHTPIIKRGMMVLSQVRCRLTNSTYKAVTVSKNVKHTTYLPSHVKTQQTRKSCLCYPQNPKWHSHNLPSNVLFCKNFKDFSKVKKENLRVSVAKLNPSSPNTKQSSTRSKGHHNDLLPTLLFSSPLRSHS